VRRQFLSVAVLASMLFTAVPAATGAESDLRSVAPAGVDRSVFAEQPSGPVIATGRVFLGSGGSAGASMVAAVAWPTADALRHIKPGDHVVTPTVGWANVAPDGSYSLRLVNERMSSSLVDDAGRLNLDLVAWNPTTRGQWGVPVLLSADTLATSQIRSATAPAAADAVRADVGLTQPLDAADALAARQPPPPQTSLVAASCTPGTLVWTLISSSDIWATIGQTWTVKPDQTSKMETALTHTSTVGIGYSVSGASGSFGYSGSSSMADSVGMKWYYSSDDRNYVVGVRYGKYGHGWCGAGYTEYQASLIAPLGTADARPNSTYFSCTPFVQGSGEWYRNWSTGTSITVSAGVDLVALIGGSLQSSSSWDTQHTLYYNLPTAGHLCVSEGTPATASRVKSSS